MTQFVYENLIIKTSLIKINAQNRNEILSGYRHIVFNEPESTEINAYGIEVIKSKTLLYSAIVGNVYCIGEIKKHASLTINNQLIICCGNSVYCLRLPDLVSLWTKTIDGSECIGIYHFENDFILQGDNCVIRLNIHGKVIWKRYASEDFFSSVENSSEFRIRKHYIQIKNWGEKNYYFKPNGRRIKPYSFQHLIVMAYQLFSK
jgi:hypothetical protein